MTTETRVGRAKPLGAEERRSAIVEAVTPLVLERGREVTSRELAEAAGVAEGTLFRAFGDKDSLIQAVVDAFLDPEPFRDAMRDIEPGEPLERKVADIMRLLRVRFIGVMGLMRALRPASPPPNAPTDYVDRVVAVLQPDLDRLAVPAEDVAYLMRLVVFASAIRPINTEREFSEEELASFVVRGVAARRGES